MPNRFQRNSIGELVCRVPLNRGSLLKSLENLVKTIETSENAVMIPTLLRDKVRVDAWELLFVAKILKASILGHDDLVEFYMNHIHQNSLSAATMGLATTGSAAQTPNQVPVSQLTPNGSGGSGGGLFEPSLSPILARQQSSPVMSTSPKLSTSYITPTTATNANNNGQTIASNGPTKDSQDTAATTANNHNSSASSNHSSQSTSSSSTTTANGLHNNLNNHQTGQTTTTTTATSKSSSASWATASQQQSTSDSGGASLTSGSPFNSPACSSSSSVSSNNISPQPATATTTVTANGNGGEPILVGPGTLADTSTDQTSTPPQATATAPATSLATPLRLAPEEPHEGLLAARPMMARLAQPPSLLQLTTTNNHINSVSEMLNSSPLDPSLDLLSQHLISLQQQQQQQAHSNGFEPSGSGLSLSISTSGQTTGDHHTNQHQGSLSSQHLLPNSALSSSSQHQQQTPTAPRHELRSSRSAGCLFRANSGASSPRTPGTPYPQAETLAGAANQNGLVGDPTSLVKLLLQVEQLKASIVHVNTLLESVVELYKKSIDNISQ